MINRMFTVAMFSSLAIPALSQALASNNASTNGSSDQNGTTSVDDETRRVVEGYFNAWTSHRVDDAMAFLDKDLQVVAPGSNGAILHVDGADQFRPGLEQFAGMTSAARILQHTVQGNRSALLYEADLPQPVGTLTIVSFFGVENGKIKTYHIVFDATLFNRLEASGTGTKPNGQGN